jgi:voltage-gated potassium channel Kch
MSQPTFAERFRYEFDNVLAKGTGALIAVLAALTLIIMVIATIVAAIFQLSPDVDAGHMMWMLLMRIMDAGAVGGDSGSWSYLFLMLAVTLGGIFVFSALIGVLSAGLEERLSEMRKGKSKVIESNHTVILGWGPQIFTVLSELIEANTSRKRACIVVVADMDATEMYEAITAHIDDLRSTRIVCRSGSPSESATLQMANVMTARSIIIIRPEGELPDVHVIKTLLAITNDKQRRASPYHIVAELNEPKYVDVAKIVGRDELELIVTSDLIARITAQTCRQSGLSTVYTELLDFGGDEIYFHAEPSLAGQTFAQALFAYETATVIGIVGADGSVRVNPDHATILDASDRLICIATDDSAIQLSDDRSEPAAMELPDRANRVVSPEHTLILGWNWRTPEVIRNLDAYVAPGSTVTIVCTQEFATIEAWQAQSALTNMTIAVHDADSTDRELLDALNVVDFHHIIVMAISDALDAEQADACTLVTLLQLRDISDKVGSPFTIVSEMLDVRNRRLAEVTKADDFIVSNRLVSLILAQVAENKHLNAVFQDLFDPEGCEIYLKPVTDYVIPEVEVTVATLIEQAHQRGEIAIGYRIEALSQDAQQQYGVVINPAKSRVVTMQAADALIVIANS